jgi:hypothetical protein
MGEKIRKSRGVRLFLRYWGTKFAAIALFYLVAIPTVKAQSQNQPSSPPGGGSQPPSGATNTNQPPASTGMAADQSPAPLPVPILQAPKPRENVISASGDFLFGQGTVSFPLGYSLKKSLNGFSQLTPGAFTVPRNSVYYGGTVSYSYGQAWYVDFSYSKGNTTGSKDIPLGELGTLPSTFSIDDSWYQLYLKYTFPQLRGKRFSAYLRAGATYISAKLDDTSSSPEFEQYTQSDKTDEIQGNFGFGLGYSIYTARRLRLGVQFEGEGFYGYRQQKSLEDLTGDFGLAPQTADINNTLYGGLGRATLHAEYRLGRSGFFRIIGEGGVEGRYSEITYPNGGGSQTESLWGPYVKLGISYAF